MRTHGLRFGWLLSPSPDVAERTESTRFARRVAVLMLVFLMAGLASVGRGQVITEFPIPFGSNPNNAIERITDGPDGNLWFTEIDRIGQMTTAGVLTEFPLPSATSGPVGIATGPDGNLWFTEYAANKIGRITTAGLVTEFPIPTINSFPGGITAGPDGNLWFTEDLGNKIGRITTAGVITEFPIGGSRPGAIAAGPDGNLWFTELSDQIGRITTAGVITEFPVPTDTSNPAGLGWGIAAGADGNLWFTEGQNNLIGRITTAGFVTEFPIPTTNSKPQAITAGSDGNLWFIEFFANQIGRITTGPLTVVIGACDSGVPNVPLSGGGTITDRILQCEASARNHGDFVRCVSHVTNDLKAKGIISGAQKGAIQSCAAK